MIRGRRHWEPGQLLCSGCDDPVSSSLADGAVTAGAAIMPGIPGVVCERCLLLAEGLAVQDLKALAAADMLLHNEFELRSEPAVQVFLDLFGWHPEVIACGAMRLHADGKPAAAYALLEAAAQAGPAAYFQVERAALLLLDGETGRAHDLLLATGPGDHPCWHLHRGALAWSVGRPEAALEHWRLQVAERPDQIVGWQTLAHVLLQDPQQRAAAVDLLERACAAFPEHHEFAAWYEDARAGQNAVQDPTDDA
jgi:tetratricopeptide (TPR) repeat protein